MEIPYPSLLHSCAQNSSDQIPLLINFVVETRTTSVQPFQAAWTWRSIIHHVVTSRIERYAVLERESKRYAVLVRHKQIHSNRKDNLVWGSPYSIHMTTDILTSSLLTQRPTSPTIWFESNKRVFALPLSGLKIDVELHVSTAVVRMRGSWINTSNEKVDCIFALPGRGIVSSVEVKIGSRVLETTVVSNDEVEEIRKMQDRFLGSKRENTQSSSKADQKITPTVHYF